MEIQKTYDYTLFKKLDGNRDVKRTKALIKSIKEMDLTMFSPIIVSDNFQIVDGQNRFAACKELGKPIYFVVMPSDKAERAMIILNKCQSQWRNEEFFHYKIEKVGGCYSELQEYMNKYGIALSYAAILFPTKEFDTRKVKEEGFTFEKGEHAEELATLFTSPEFRNLPYSRTKAFTRAVRIFFENSTPKQRQKLLRKSIGIAEFANHHQYLTAFRNLVNMRR